MDDALPKTIRTIPTTRANMARFTSDKVSKHSICLQGTCETWHPLGHLIKETAACYFISYYIWYAGQYLIVNFKAIIVQYR